MCDKRFVKTCKQAAGIQHRRAARLRLDAALLL